MELIKTNEPNAASFYIVPKKKIVDKPQIRLIIGLLEKGINERRNITIEDIRMIHAEYCFQMNREYLGFNWFEDGNDGIQKWRRAKTVQEYYSRYCCDWRSIPWFKINLGEAILRGKILAIPIIEI